MKAGDLVKFRNPKTHAKRTFLITHVHGRFVSLMGYPENQVFSPNTLEVINESR